MKTKRFTKLIVLLLTTSFIGACDINNATSSLTSETSNSSISKEDSKSSSSESKVSTSESKQNSQSSSSSSSSSSSKTSSSSYTMNSNTTTCDNHALDQEEIIVPATIVQKGIKRFSCLNCQGYKEEYYYDLDECAFEDKTFVYDGQERTLYIEGMVPYGLTVKYENNKLTAIGSSQAKAKFYDENNALIAEKTATLNIVENTGIPEIRITTENGEDPFYKEKEEYTNMTASLSNCEAKYAFNNKTGGIRVRGNSTNQASVNKRAWRLKFDKKINMLGLNAGPDGKGFKSWVLMADNFDYSYFRNATAWSFGNTLFNYSGNYSSHFQHVNVYMNDEYRGVYMLAEQQQANYGRIGIDEPQDDDKEEDKTSLKRGYLVEIDGLVITGQSKEEYKFTTGNSSSSQGGMFPGMGGQSGDGIADKGYVVKTDIFSDEQFQFIKKYINNVLTIYKNAVNGKKLQILDDNAELIDSPYSSQYETLNAVMDIESIFKMYVLQEYCKNYDCGWGSFYLFVDFSSKSTHKRLTCGATWDFDLGLGNKKSDGHPNPDGDFITKTNGNSFMGGGTEFNPWLYLLSKTDFFNDLIGKYYTVFANSAAYEKVMQYINYETSAFAADFANEYALWAGDSGRNSMGTRAYSTHAEAVSYLTNWLTSRKEYLDSKLLSK